MKNITSATIAMHLQLKQPISAQETAAKLRNAVKPILTAALGADYQTRLTAATWVCSADSTKVNEVQYIVLIGSWASGFRAVGPFATIEETNMAFDDSFAVLPLHPGGKEGGAEKIVFQDEDIKKELQALIALDLQSTALNVRSALFNELAQLPVADLTAATTWEDWIDWAQTHFGGQRTLNALKNVREYCEELQRQIEQEPPEEE